MQQSILQTLAWFDIFEQPLTAEELYIYVWQYKEEITFEDFVKQLSAAAGIREQNGYYMLAAGAASVESRQQSVPLLQEKLHIAKRACNKLRWIPFVRAVFVCNTVAAATASADSDIDVLILIKKGRMWLTRFLITAVLTCFRLRRHGKRVANRICLSFFVTDDALDFSSIRWGEPDIYLIYWLTQLIPVYDPETLLRTIQQSNAWVRDYLPHGFSPYLLHKNVRAVDHACSKFFKNFFEKAWHGTYGDILEQQAKHIQELKMKQNYDSVKDAHDTRVIISDRMLKFHENDRRAYYRELWEQKLRKE